MGEIVLVRHGQANSEAKDEDGYDRLTDLGRQQSAWLGEWLAAQSERFDTHLAGGLRRHRETAEAMGLDFSRVQVDPRFDEMDYFNLGKALEETHGVPFPDAEAFADHVPKVMEAWHRAEIRGNETFDAFESRVTEALIDAAQEGRRVLAVTSGGVIAMALRHILRLDPTRFAHILMPIRNSSIHRVHVRGRQMILAGFNATPHLDPPDRATARTTF